MFDRRYFRYFDWVSFGLTIALLSIGLLFVFSATYTPEKPFSLFFKKQLGGAVSGLCIYFFFCIKDLRKLARWGYFSYFAVLALLLYTSIGGLIGMGGKRWISLYFFRFQPSELAKLFLPIFVACSFSELEKTMYRSVDVPSIRNFLWPGAILVFSFLIIRKQPDLGTALIILFSGLILFWFVGIDKRFFLVLGLIGLLGAPLLWRCLKPYQQNRILVLCGQGDARKERYQVEQSKIAIGSGGFMGKGLLRGTQNKLQFLPEDHTDFIFSVICEELGFLGGVAVLTLFAMLFARIIFVILQLKSLFDQIIGVGLLIHVLLSTCINVAMVTGMLPIVGIPLPLVSYGITNLWITLASLGWLNNLAIRRFYY